MLTIANKSSYRKGGKFMEIAEKIVKIFEAYNLCDSGSVGQLCRQEMLITLGKQNNIDWSLFNDKDIEKLKARQDAVHKLEAYKNIFINE